MSGHDPQGAALADQLEGRLRRAGYAGFILVIGEDGEEEEGARVHWRIAFDAGWNAMFYNRDTGELRIRVSSRDFKTKEQADRVLAATAGVVFNARDVLGRTAGLLGQLCESIERSVDVDHEPFEDYQPPPPSVPAERETQLLGALAALVAALAEVCPPELAAAVAATAKERVPEAGEIDELRRAHAFVDELAEEPCRATGPDGAHFPRGCYGPDDTGEPPVPDGAGCVACESRRVLGRPVS